MLYVEANLKIIKKRIIHLLFKPKTFEIIKFSFHISIILNHNHQKTNKILIKFNYYLSIFVILNKKLEKPLKTRLLICLAQINVTYNYYYYCMSYINKKKNDKISQTL
jgi:hypothetical protein